MAGTEMAGIPVRETEILIVGSSMVGLTLAALLPKYGVRDCICVDKHPSTAIHARAALFQCRSMQIYREMGLYEQMERESHAMYDTHTGLFHAESLASTLEEGKVGTFLKDVNEGIEHISPTSRLFLAQQTFEPLLRKRAMENGADIRFSTEMIDFQQDDEGVTALLQNIDTGSKELVRSRYMVGCDGNRSLTRKKLGIPVKGHGMLSHSLTIYFKSDLSRFVEGKYNGVIYINNEKVRGFFRLDKTGRVGFFAVNTYGVRGTEESRYPAKGITTEKAAQMLRDAIGATVEFEITLLVPWRAECNYAEHFVNGRVLLAGDAAHIMTPNGGFGGNTGIQDAQNLAWKLALVVQNKAGPDLVSKTYEDERWPVAKKTVDQVFERYVTRTAPELMSKDIELEKEVPEPHLELGYRYHSRALMTTELGALTSDPSSAKADPGSIAHHCMISTKYQDGSSSKPHPVADLIGDSFVLICGHDALAWVQAGSRLAEQGIEWLPDLSVHQLARDASNTFYDKYAVSSQGCVLIRPDNFVAWSTASKAVHGLDGIRMSSHEIVLQHVMRRILCFDDKYPQEVRSKADSTVGVGVDASVEHSLATNLFQQIKALEKEKAESLARVAELDAQLADLRRMSELQNEVALLGMKLRKTAHGTDTDTVGGGSSKARIAAEELHMI